jgi:sulfatase-like protein
MRRFVLATLAVVAASTTFLYAPSAKAADATQTQKGSSATQPARNRKPNILFIILDDLGVDQLKIFGYGGDTPPLTPNIDAIARAGIRFRNTWSMPECSPSRAVFFEGRYPLRTNIYAAILTDDLANSQVSPYEYTTPKILRTVGYKSGMFGKFHLGGPENNPFGNSSPNVLGWDRYDGFMSGPQPIDTTIGGQFADKTYSCGFIPNSDVSGGYDNGACYFSRGGPCTQLTRTQQQPTPGRTCLEQGGLFVPNQSCSAPLRKSLDFTKPNAYYVWPRVIDGIAVPFNDLRARSYMSDGTNSAAIQWIHQQSRNQPWMATVSYSNIHTPYQQPRASLVPVGEQDSSGFQCTGNDPDNVEATRIISNQMGEAVDTEIGDLFVAIGLATRNPNGTLNYHPENTDTMVIMVGDNGTYAPGVKEPFDLNYAKGYVYQTGVWVPLIVSGPLVASPDREVESMVNIADLFQLFGEVAGVDVHQVIPPSHIVDSVSMLPYLTNPNQASLRTTNFTQTGNNIHSSPPSPCVVALTSPPTCIQLFNVQPLCEFEGGTWYGPGGTQQFDSCCAVKNSGLYPDGLNILPDAQSSTRNDHYKLVQITTPNCSTKPADEEIRYELYKVDEVPDTPKIDRFPDADLCSTTPPGCPAGLSGEDLDNYNALLPVHQATLASEPLCPGDGNEDKVVNQTDLSNWMYFSLHNGLSSWYDLNMPTPDGFTNMLDRNIIMMNLGTNCLQAGPQKVQARGSSGSTGAN